MNDIDWQNENFLTTLSDMEQSWQQAVDLRTTFHKVITGLSRQMKERDMRERRSEEELSSLRATVTDLNMKLETAHSEITRLLENKKRQIEDKTEELGQELQIRDREITDLKAQHIKSIQDLTAGTQQTLLEMENQLETVLANEEQCRDKLHKLEEVNKMNEMKLHDWNRVSKKMCDELADVKSKLQSSRFANTKLREEIALWKKYCEKVEGERKSYRREVDQENRVLKRFGQIESYMKSERAHRSLTLDIMNQFGNKLIKDLKQLRCPKETRTVVASIESQTEGLEEDKIESRRKTEHLEFMKTQVSQLEEELKKCEVDSENLRQQNLTLRDVIRAMKQERESWLQEKEHIEEEVRVTKLEESVRMLRNNLMNEEKEVSVWHALQDVKKEVSSLKNKTINKSTIKDPEIKKMEVQGVQYGVSKSIKK